MARTRLAEAAAIAAALVVVAAGPPAVSAPGHAPGPAAVHQQAAANRGLWVWQSVDAVRILRFADTHQVGAVWLATSSSPGRAERNRVARTVALGHDHGIRVTALGGSPRWATHPAWAVEWARAALGITQIRGIHVDVEPYALRRWNGDRPRVIRLYLSMLDQLDALRGSLDADVPFWFGTIGTHGRTLADEVLERVDRITVMSYRDRALGPNGIADISRDWLRRADRAGVPVRLGAETNRLGSCPQCTFYEEGAERLRRAQQRVAGVFADRESFAGVAVHDWVGWRALLRDDAQR